MTTPRASSILQQFRPLATDRRGVAAVEMALLSAFILFPMLGGFAGLSQALELQARLDRGVHAALMAAWQNPGTITLSADITKAVQDAYGSTAPTVTAVATYYCINPTGTRAGVTGSATPPTCTAPQIAGRWVAVKATVGFTPVINIGTTGWNQAGAGGIVTLSSSATVRVQ